MNNEREIDLFFDGPYGKGIYLAESPEICDRLLNEDERTGLRQLLICEVNTGIEEHVNNSIELMNKKEENNENFELYKSARVIFSQSYVYILYKSARCYPKYLVTYTY